MTAQLLRQVSDTRGSSVGFDQVRLDLLPQEINITLKLDDLGQHDLAAIELGVRFMQPLLKRRETPLVAKHPRIEPDLIHGVGVLRVCHKPLTMRVIQGCKKILDLGVNRLH